MGKKINKLIWIVIILILILVGIIYFYLKSDDATTSETSTNTSSNTTTRQAIVGTQTIVKTITGSGEISSNLTEKLELNTYRYLKEVLVEENQAVAAGERLLKYSNGTYLTAPYDLVVAAIAVGEIGDICKSSHYIEVKDTTNLLMTLSIAESELSSVKVGQEVEITVNAYTDKKYTGTITKINEIGTYASNGSSFKAIVSFKNDRDVKIGMSASSVVTIDKAENVIAIPIQAVQTRNDTKYVIVVNEDGTTSNVTVTTGLSNDAYVEIKSGLSGGETVEYTVTTNNNSGNFRSFSIPSGGGSVQIREM